MSNIPLNLWKINNGISFYHDFIYSTLGEYKISSFTIDLWIGKSPAHFSERGIARQPK